MFLRDKKLKRLLIGSLCIALALPLINVFVIYPQFSNLIGKNIEASANQLAAHIDHKLDGINGWSFVKYGGTPSAESIHLLESYRSEFGLRKIKIFSAGGLAVYSTDEADVGRLNKNDYFHQIVAKGQLFTKVVKKETQSLEGQRYQADVIETYVPIMRAGEFMGAFELYYDITSRVDSLDKVVLMASILPFAVSGLLLLVLVWGMKSLDRSIGAHRLAKKELQGSLETLADKNQQLDAQHSELMMAHEQLKKAQSQMLQREKMASVGQLAAGVAHEINNPMGFISGNIRSLRKYLLKISDYLAAVHLQCREHLPAEQQQELQQQRKAAKIDFILEDIPDLLDESLDGAERVKDIVQNLKSFSHVDEAEFKQSDLNECLENTLKIIANELKYKVTLHKDYAELPLVPCFPQQLSQVFMNILINAAHAIETAGEVRIRTWSDQQQAYVAISDNGCGIPQQLQSRIFEPFFTTKDVGSGTGLGMSIAYEIVNNHHGKIDLQSAPGQGTTFTLSLPLQARAELTAE